MEVIRGTTLAGSGATTTLVGWAMVYVEDSLAFPFWALLQPEDPPDTEFRDSMHLGQYFDGHSGARIG